MKSTDTLYGLCPHTTLEMMLEIAALLILAVSNNPRLPEPY